MKRLQDYYFKKAKKEGYVARSVFKLQEINKKHQVLRKGDLVLDLGCYPGSWMQYIAERIGKDGAVVGVDRTELKIQLQKNMHFIQADIYKLNTNLLNKHAQKYNLICSDMAPNSSGIKDVDAARSLQLCQRVLDIAQEWLMSKGSLIVKTFQGTAFDPLLKRMRSEYQTVKIIKPESSRNESREIFLLGMTLKHNQGTE
jgi:23S rRNA (uridine2552-2'-O)-methyltransferase